MHSSTVITAYPLSLPSSHPFSLISDKLKSVTPRLVRGSCTERPIRRGVSYIREKHRLAKKERPSRIRPSAQTQVGSGVVSVPVENETDAVDWLAADPNCWKSVDKSFDGSFRYSSLGQVERIEGAIATGIAAFRAAPATYTSIYYQKDMVNDSWPDEFQSYTLIHRKETRRFSALEDSGGDFQITIAIYQPLPTIVRGGGLRHPSLARFKGESLKKYASPGRGENVGDIPNLKLHSQIDPFDVSQGSVGDCWLLCGMSSLAEFSGVLEWLFRKTLDIHRLPVAGPNTYTITLWDFPIWTEVDVTIDERPVLGANGTDLLAARLSSEGELWVAYLEKALAAHCGGWDKIDGGWSPHAWAMMTGCREQYTMRRSERSVKCGHRWLQRPVAHAVAASWRMRRPGHRD